jgi:hypothetical protein
MPRFASIASPVAGIPDRPEAVCRSQQFNQHTEFQFGSLVALGFIAG